MQTLLRTPLYERHVALGARMVPFAGWEMPVQYEGVIPEHRAVREDCGVFDVSHMGELEVEGPGAHELLQTLLSNDLDRVDVGGAQYTLLTNERGGIVDDLIAYRLEPGRYLLVVNAANKDADYEWLKDREQHGNDMGPDTDAISAGLGWVCALDKEFTGVEELRRIKAEGPSRKLVPFVMAEPAIPRQGMAIEEGGEVTSGSHSPMLDRGIGMGYVLADSATPDTQLTIDVRGKLRRARVVKRPIYKREE